MNKLGLEGTQQRPTMQNAPPSQSQQHSNADWLPFGATFILQSLQNSQGSVAMSHDTLNSPTHPPNFLIAPFTQVKSAGAADGFKLTVTHNTAWVFWRGGREGGRVRTHQEIHVFQNLWITTNRLSQPHHFGHQFILNAEVTPLQTLNSSTQRHSKTERAQNLGRGKDKERTYVLRYRVVMPWTSCTTCPCLTGRGGLLTTSCCLVEGHMRGSGHILFSELCNLVTSKLLGQDTAVGTNI